MTTRVASRWIWSSKITPTHTLDVEVLVITYDDEDEDRVLHDAIETHRLTLTDSGEWSTS